MAGKSFKGNLEILSLSDILQSLAMNRHSGTLVVNDGKREKKVFFAEGEILLLSSGRRMRLGDLLVAAGKISEEDVDLALKLQKQSRKKLGEILVEEGFCEEEDISRILRMQVEEEIYDLFLWRKAEFEFLADQMPEDMAQESPNLTRLNLNTNSLIMEALRRLDEWSLIQDAVPTTKEVFTLIDPASFQEADVPDILKHRAESIDGKTTVEGLAERFFLSEFELCQHLATLVKAGAIRALTQEELVERAEAAYALNDFNAAAALYGRLAEYHPDHPKILIPLADSLRRTGVEKQALAIYEEFSVQLEQGGREPDRLRQCYEAILQLDPSRQDLARKIEDLDLRMAASSKRSLVPLVTVVLLLVAGGAGFMFRERIGAWLGPAKKMNREATAQLLESTKRMEDAARGLLDKGKLAEASERCRQWHGAAVTIWKEHMQSDEFRRVKLPVVVSTVPPGFDVYVNDIYQGLTSLGKPTILGKYRPSDALKVEVYYPETRGKQDAVQRFNFDADTYQEPLNVAIYEKPQRSILGDGWLEAGVARAEGLNAFLVPSRAGVLRALRLETGDMEYVQGWDKKVRLGEYGDLFSAPVIHQDRLYVGVVELDGASGVAVVALPRGQPPVKPRLLFPAGQPVLAAPLVLSEQESGLRQGRLVFASLSGAIYGYGLAGRTPLWTAATVGAVTHPPVHLLPPGVPGGVAVFVASDARVYAFAVEDGRLLWSHPLESPAEGPPVGRAGDVVVPLEDGRVVAVGAAGASVASRTLYRDESGKAVTTIGGPGGALFVGTQEGVVRALSSDGQLLWTRDFRRSNRRRPKLALQAGRLLVAMDGPEVFALETRRGEIVWQGSWSEGGQVISPISVFGRVVFLGTEKSHLYIFELGPEE